MPDAKLVCSKCGTVATGDLLLVAAAGKTHWRILTHNVGAAGKKETRNARSCGIWVEQEASRA